MKFFFHMQFEHRKCSVTQHQWTIRTWCQMKWKSIKYIDLNATQLIRKMCRRLLSKDSVSIWTWQSLEIQPSIDNISALFHWHSPFAFTFSITDKKHSNKRCRRISDTESVFVVTRWSRVRHLRLWRRSWRKSRLPRRHWLAKFWVPRRPSRRQPCQSVLLSDGSVLTRRRAPVRLSVQAFVGLTLLNRTVA